MLAVSDLVNSQNMAFQTFSHSKRNLAHFGFEPAPTDPEPYTLSTVLWALLYYLAYLGLIYPYSGLILAIGCD